MVPSAIVFKIVPIHLGCALVSYSQSQSELWVGESQQASLWGQQTLSRSGKGAQRGGETGWCELKESRIFYLKVNGWQELFFQAWGGGEDWGNGGMGLGESL